MAWDLIEPACARLAGRALTPPAEATPITGGAARTISRLLRGAAALIAAPPFAKEVVA